MSGDIDASDYKDIKAASESRISFLENEIFDLNKGSVSVKPLLDNALK